MGEEKGKKSAEIKPTNFLYSGINDFAAIDFFSGWFCFSNGKQVVLWVHRT